MTEMDDLCAVLELHRKDSIADLVGALPSTLRACGYEGDASVIITGESLSELHVLASTHRELKPGSTILSNASLQKCLRAESLMPDVSVPISVSVEGDVHIHDVLQLRAADETYGLLFLHRASSKLKPKLAPLVAEHLGLALYRCLLDEERQRVHALNAAKLNSVAQAGLVLRELELDRVLAKLMELAISCVCGEVGCIAVIDAEDASLKVRTEWGMTQEMLDSLKTPDGTRLTTEVSRTRNVVLMKGAEELQALAPTPIRAQLESLLVLPLKAHKRFSGCVVIANGTSLKPADVELVQMITDLSSTAIDNALLHRAAIDQEGLRQQLKIAGDIQRGLLPAAPPQMDGAEVAGLCIPCEDSSGDYFDYFSVENTHLGFVIGDATGHGIGAALIATTARASLRALVGTQPLASLNMAAIIGSLNELTAQDFHDDKFMTLFFGLYDTKSRRLTYVSAGHSPPMIIYSAQGDRFSSLESTGLPLGMFAGVTFEQKTTEPLNRGDVLLLMTDGVNEARNPWGEEFGLKRVRQAVKELSYMAPKDLVCTLTERVFEFVRGRHRDDDITTLCLRI